MFSEREFADAFEIASAQWSVDHNVAILDPHARLAVTE
jgi:hypothetical protein